MNRIKELRNLLGIKQNDLCTQLDVSQSTLSGWENGKYEPDLKALNKMCDIFKVSTDYLLGRSSKIYCYDCGYSYDPVNSEEKESHRKYHNNWEAATKKYGFCWNYFKSDELELLARKIIKNPNSDENSVLCAVEDILKAQFSNELREHNFEYKNDFRYFAARQLEKASFKDMIPDEIYEQLVKKYGAYLDIIDEKPFNARDERDIRKDLESLREKLANKELGPAAFDGEDIPEDDTDLFLGQVELMLRRLKAKNKEKYTPDKYKK